MHLTSRWLTAALLALSVIGLFDASYLTYHHYSGTKLICNLTHGCDTVLTSQYATIFNVPIALLGVLFYFAVLLVTLYSLQENIMKRTLLLLGAVGFGTSLGLVFLQAFVIHAWCQYCLLSAITSTLIFLTSGIIWLTNKEGENGKRQSLD